MEEMTLEMLLHLLVCYPPRALQTTLIEGPFQPCGKGGNLLMVTLCNFIKNCIRTSNDTTVPKIMVNFCNIWATLAVVPIYQAISAASLFNNHTMFSRTIDSI